MIMAEILDFLEMVELFCTEIFLVNPCDFIDMDMNNFYSHCYFVSNPYIEKGTLYQIKDRDLKSGFLEFIKEHPDRVWRGTKMPEGEWKHDTD